MPFTSAIVKRAPALCVAFASLCAMTLTATRASASPAPSDQVGFTSTLQAAHAAYDRQDYHLAAGLYERVVKDNPVNPAYWRALAAAHYLAGEYRAAIPAYKTALELRQDQPANLAYFLARTYARSGDAVSGMQWLRQAVNWALRISETRGPTKQSGYCAASQGSPIFSASWTPRR